MINSSSIFNIAETPDTLVFYTLNGSRPEPFQRSGKLHTFPFKESFALNPGKVWQLLDGQISDLNKLHLGFDHIGNHQGHSHITRWLQAELCGD